MIYQQAGGNPYQQIARRRARGEMDPTQDPLQPQPQARPSPGGGWGGLMAQGATSAGPSVYAQEARRRAAPAPVVDPETVPQQSRQELQQERVDAHWNRLRDVRDGGGHLKPGQLRRLELLDRARASADSRRRADEALAELDRERRSLDDPAGQAAFLAPRREAAERWRENARGELARGLAGQGLTDSSYAAAAQGGLESDFAEGMAQNNAQWEEQRAQREEMLRDLNLRLVEARRSGDPQLVQQALNDLSQFRLELRRMQDANRTDWGGIAQAYISAAGTAAGGGF